MTDWTEANAILELEPKPVWRFFAGIAAVPRPSGREQQVRAHLRQVAEQYGLAVREDQVGNLAISVPASPGCENAPPTILQGHLDMVCEKNADTAHDFEREGIRLVLDRDEKTGEQIVRAAGTTLGADNGIGVSLALAAATSADVVHGPLEILCTVDEEVGMTGAAALEPGFVTGDRLINLDSEDDEVIYIGCAGGGDITLTWEFPLKPLDGRLELFRVRVSGLRGGHSGGDIHENRANANKVLTRTLLAAKKTVRLVSISGGSKRNAIPREATAIVAGRPGLTKALRKAAAEVRTAVVRESAEPAAQIQVESVDRATATGALSPADSRRLLWALTALPNGVLEMHQKLPGLVQTSNNVATISTEPAEKPGYMRVTVGNLSRSSMEGRVEATWEQIAAVGHLTRARVQTGHQYPGWDPNPDSPLLALCRCVYQQLFGREPRVTAIHAGLECGIIGQRMGGRLDMVSIGPRIAGAHSPDERVYVASVQKSYQYLKAILAELART